MTAAASFLDAFNAFDAYARDVTLGYRAGGSQAGVRAHVRKLKPEEFVGAHDQSRLLVVFMADQITGAAPAKYDTLTWGGVRRAIVAVRDPEIAGTAITYKCEVAA